MNDNSIGYVVILKSIQQDEEPITVCLHSVEGLAMAWHKNISTSLLAMDGTVFGFKPEMYSRYKSMVIPDTEFWKAITESFPNTIGAYE